MKKIITVLSVLLPLCISAQVSFTFEEGSAEGWIFNEPDRWKADGDNALSGLFSLHHVYDNIESAVDVALFSIAGLCPDCAETTWEFTVRHRADPSSSNKWAFILASDAGIGGITPGAGFNGYATGVNFTGYDDTLRLWQIAGGKATAVITTDVNWQNDIGTDGVATVIVTRSTGGEWYMVVEVKDPVLFTGMAPEGNGKDIEQGDVRLVQASWSEKQGTEGMNTKASGTGHKTWSTKPVKRAGEGSKGDLWKYAGISYTYTSTRDRMLWLDDVSVNGVFISDTLPPRVVSVTAPAPDILRVIFDEEPDPSFMVPGNMIITGGAVVNTVVRITPEVCELNLSDNISNRVQHMLTFNNLCDPAGNCSSSVAIGFVPVYGVIGDVVITEIMADPSPPVQLPDDEYLELTNLTGDSLSLRSWLLIADKDTVILPPLWMGSGERLILCSPSDVPQFSVFGRVIGLAGFPSLSDGGETLSLRDSRGALIHSVTYSNAFYKDKWRSGVGWSVEMSDTGNPFNAPDTWRASADPAGGTPGRPNSMDVPAPDTRCPEIIAAYPLENVRIRIVFDETLTGAFDQDEWLADGISAVAVVSDDIADRAVVITLREPLAAGRICTVQLPPAAADFAGIPPCLATVSLGLPEAPAPGDVMFNEVLFDPVPPCNDYIELYNNSDKTVDLSRLYLSSSQDGSKSSPTLALSPLPRQLLPGRYVAVTTVRDVIADYYSCSDRREIHEAGTIPSMPDDDGAVVLLDQTMNILDRLVYSSSWHMDFLSGREGIALEKVSPELSSGYSYNWHSASEKCNWGTPGAVNSAVVSDTDGEHGLSLSSERISPDGDGYEEVISVMVAPGGSDNVVTVTVFNAGGYAVRRLAERFSAGEEAQFIWDGTGDDGHRLPAGLYLIMAESYNSRGQSRRWKEVCALLYR